MRACIALKSRIRYLTQAWYAGGGGVFKGWALQLADRQTDSVSGERKTVPHTFTAASDAGTQATFAHCQNHSRAVGVRSEAQRSQRGTLPRGTSQSSVPVGGINTCVCVCVCSHTPFELKVMLKVGSDSDLFLRNTNKVAGTAADMTIICLAGVRVGG